MKRILNACLNQTIHFQLKDGIPHEAAVKEVEHELKQYKASLEKGRTRYLITEEQTQPDGSVIIRIKKQYLDYGVGDYM